MGDGATQRQTGAEPSPFWTFSLAVYGRQGVPPACLRLQDEHGADVNIALCALWLGTLGRAIVAADVARLRETMAPWVEEVVRPLRQVRRWLKDPTEPFAGAATENLRARLKAVELESERLQQEAIAAFVRDHAPGRPATASRALLEANLAAYAEAIGADFPDIVVEPLLAAATALLTDGSSA